MIHSIDHLVFAAEDLEEAAHNLGTLLGRAPSWHGSHAAWGTANVLFRLGDIYAEVLSPVGSGPVADSLRQHLASRGEGLFAIAFGTHDAAACAATLRERGLSPSDVIDGEGRSSEGAVRRWRNVMLPVDDTRGVNSFVIEHLSPADALPHSEAITDGAVSGIDHVVILSPALDDTRDLYRDRLGIRLALDREFPERSTRLLFFKVGGVVLEIGGSLKEAPDVSRPDEAWGVAWKVAEIELTRDRLLAAGWSVSEVRSGRKPQTRVCTVRDNTHGVATLLIGSA